MRRICHRVNRPSTVLAYIAIFVIVVTVINLLGILSFHRWELSRDSSIFGHSRRIGMLLSASSNASKLPTRASGKSTNFHLRDTLVIDSQDSVHILELIANRTPFHFNPKTFRKDKSAAYRIHDDVVVPDDLESVNQSSVCLATQGSVDRLMWLVELAELWDGPVSVAVFVPGSEMNVARVYISFLRSCSEAIRLNFSFHFLYPAGIPPEEEKNIVLDDQEFISCSNYLKILQKLRANARKSSSDWRRKALYPQNHLRNLARDGCKAPYFFLTDIDIMPKANLASDLSVFLKDNICKKCILIVPTYEIPESSPMPHTKKELMLMVRKRQARPFHEAVFIHNQHATNHKMWEHLKETEGLKKAYKLNSFEFFYEPFYISQKNVPRHDERFVGYGFTRNTQVYETYLAGFEFWVLNNAFAVHRGMQAKRSRGYAREKQNSLNRKVFQIFKKDMAKKYNMSALKAKWK